MNRLQNVVTEKYLVLGRIRTSGSMSIALRAIYSFPIGGHTGHAIVCQQLMLAVANGNMSFMYDQSICLLVLFLLYST